VETLLPYHDGVNKVKPLYDVVTQLLCSSLSLSKSSSWPHTSWKVHLLPW